MSYWAILNVMHRGMITDEMIAENYDKGLAELENPDNQALRWFVAHLIANPDETAEIQIPTEYRFPPRDKKEQGYGPQLEPFGWENKFMNQRVSIYHRWSVGPFWRKKIFSERVLAFGIERLKKLLPSTADFSVISGESAPKPAKFSHKRAEKESAEDAEVAEGTPPVGKRKRGDSEERETRKEKMQKLDMSAEDDEDNNEEKDNKQSEKSEQVELEKGAAEKEKEKEERDKEKDKEKEKEKEKEKDKEKEKAKPKTSGESHKKKKNKQSSESSSNHPSSSSSSSSSSSKSASDELKQMLAQQKNNGGPSVASFSSSSSMSFSSNSTPSAFPLSKNSKQSNLAAVAAIEPVDAELLFSKTPELLLYQELSYLAALEPNEAQRAKLEDMKHRMLAQFEAKHLRT